MNLKDQLMKKNRRVSSSPSKDKENATVTSSSSSSGLSDTEYDDHDDHGNIDKKSLPRKKRNSWGHQTVESMPCNNDEGDFDLADLRQHRLQRTNTNTSLLIKGELLEDSQSVCLDDMSSTCSVDHADPTVDMRFTLTPQERHGVLLLQAACEEHNVPYKHLFELAKYVLVSHSSCKDSDPKADEKRTATALKRLKKLRQWEAKYHMDQLDVLQAFDEIQTECPNYFLTQFTTDIGGRHIVGHHILDPPTDYATSKKHPEQTAKFLLAEHTRMNLAAANLEEARRGIAFLTIVTGKITLAKVYHYVRLVGISKENIQDLHCHRVKKIHGQLPPAWSHVTSWIFPLLPKKIKERFTPYTNLEDLHEQVHMRPLPPGVDVSSDNNDDPYLHQPRRCDVRDWVEQRQAMFDETVRKLTL